MDTRHTVSNSPTPGTEPIICPWSPLTMNRFDIVLEPVESPSPSVSKFERQSSAPPILEVSTACCVDVLITRRHKPINSIRRMVRLQ